MRHGKAQALAETDALRPLTPAGQETALATVKTLQNKGYKPDVLLTSPFLRAQQTAQIAGDVFGTVPHTLEELDGRLSGKGLIDLAKEQLKTADCVMLVGHNPNFSLAASMLRQEYTPFEAGTAAVFDMTVPNAPKFLALEKK